MKRRHLANVGSSPRHISYRYEPRHAEWIRNYSGEMEERRPPAREKCGPTKFLTACRLRTFTISVL